ncbi:RsbT co-antagonist protein RsbRA [Enhygromyxa salina]|uniref:RsbT co-antagonist protein RsbRA n=1 Tax=Enhygromyxa salina TaxID=215803 RepID=A0A2S9YGY5_9BACT|nr:STAS domain-containing protein [Enhygromyxa salina]PRQ04368.1 RsbT co-antagonist protein RsbRA [Enhygromyxa salina]
MKPFDQDGRAELIAAVTERLLRRSASVFQDVGEPRCRAHVEAAVAALERDLDSDSCEAARASVVSLLDELMAKGLNFSDLRFFSRKLREQVRAAVPEDLALAVEDWFYEHLSVSTMQFMVRRDDALVNEAAKRGVEHFESQLAELEEALEEKTQLLETIREASTPIAPVVSGILVVPLVGVFDGFRARLLTEKLLTEISRVQARVAILDISGVPLFDTDAAQLVISLARSVRLLGAEVFLVGMSANSARTIVALGIDLSNLTTLGTLQDGLAKALATQRLKIVPMSRPRRAEK